MQSIRHAAVEGVTLGIYECTGILRASPDHLLRHRRCDAGGIEEEKVFRVEIKHAVLLELITAADEWRNPCTVRIEIGVLDPRLIGKSAGCGIAHRRCLGKYLFQASVGCEGLASQRDAVERVAHGAKRTSPGTDLWRARLRIHAMCHCAPRQSAAGQASSYFQK